MTALSTLPTEVQQLIRDAFRDACYASSVEELCKIRLVNVRLAATFYKRCIMLTMLERYQTVPVSDLTGRPPHPPLYYDLFQDFRSPVKMLPRHTLDPRDSNDFYVGYGDALRGAEEQYGAATVRYYRSGVLRLQLMTMDPGVPRRAPADGRGARAHSARPPAQAGDRAVLVRAAPSERRAHRAHELRRGGQPVLQAQVAVDLGSPIWRV